MGFCLWIASLLGHVKIQSSMEVSQESEIFFVQKYSNSGLKWRYRGLCSSVKSVGQLLFELSGLFWDESLKFWKQFLIVFLSIEGPIGSLKNNWWWRYLYWTIVGPLDGILSLNRVVIRLRKNSVINSSLWYTEVSLESRIFFVQKYVN